MKIAYLKAMNLGLIIQKKQIEGQTLSLSLLCVTLYDYGRPETEGYIDKNYLRA